MCAQEMFPQTTRLLIAGEITEGIIDAGIWTGGEHLLQAESLHA